MKETYKYYTQVLFTSGKQENRKRFDYEFEALNDCEKFKTKKGVIAIYLRKVSYDDLQRPYKDELFKKVYEK